jgi:TPR repeat protein
MNRKKIILAGVVSTLMFAGVNVFSAAAQDAPKAALPEKSIQAIQDIAAQLKVAQPGPSTDALLAVLDKRAKDGEAAALRLLGDLYRDGRLVAKDPQKALAFYEQALARGDKGVVTSLGDLYYRSGAALNLDPAKALEFYQKGVDNKDRWAIAGLGDVYREGKIVPQDLAKAISLYQQAADLGNTAVYGKIGDLYYNSGAALNVDPAKALEFYQKGADSGDRWAIASLGDVYRAGKIVPQDLEKALSFYQQAAELGNAAVYSKIGDLYYRSAEALQVDPAKALDFYQKGADSGDRWAIASLGDVYREGKIVPPDLGKALAFYQKAADLGNAAVDAKLGEIYYRNGLELKVDPKMAIQFYQQGIDKGDTWAMAGLGDIYREGKIVPQDPAKALKLYQASYAAGNKRSYSSVVDLLLKGTPSEQKKGQAMITEGLKQDLPGLVPLQADAYLYGRGVAFNPMKGLAILKRAAANGDIPATLRLVQLYADGYAKISKNPKLATKTLDGLADQLPADRLAAERLYVTGTTAASPKQMQTFVAGLDALRPASQASVVSRIAWRNENTFVYALQNRMKQSGDYTGPINGMLTSRTISGLYQECLKFASQSVCKAGPLSSKVRPLLSNIFRVPAGS